MKPPLPNPWVLTIHENRPKFLATQQHLAAEGIQARVFYGFDYRTSGIHTAFTYEKDNPGAGYKVGSKICCMILSHIALWKCLEQQPPEQDCWTVMEDDVRFNVNWKAHFDFSFQNLPPDWDMLFPGSCCCEDHFPKQVNGSLFSVEYLNCTHCYIVRRKALSTLIEQCSRLHAPVDIAIALDALPKLKVFAILPRIAYQFGTELPP